MNIKTKVTAFAAALLSVGTLFTACNDIDEGNRYVELPPVEVKRTVLLEEFTGQMCKNCPEAHADIKSLKKQYGENLIVVGIHSGGDAFSIAEGDPVWEAAGVTGLRLADGETYLKKAGFKSGMGLPIGNINRTSGLKGRDKWSDIIRDEIERESEVAIKLSTELDEAGKQLKVTTQLRSVAEFDGTLQLWVVESGIKTMQYLPDGSTDWNYTHDHVFRGTINGLDGGSVSVDPDLEVGAEATHTVAIKDNWNVDNLAVVAIVSNGSGVQQAAEKEVVEKEPDPETPANPDAPADGE